MSKFIRFLTVLFSLVILVGLVATLALLIRIPVLTVWADNMANNYSWFLTALAVVVMFFILITLVNMLTGFFTRDTKEMFTIKHDKGTIEISDKSIESVANNTMAGIPGVQRYHSKVRGRPSTGKVKLELFAETDATASLADTGAVIQQRVEDALAQSLDINPSHVDVRMKPYEEARAAKNATAPRVV